MRLIDADALKESIDANVGRIFTGCTIGEALKMMTDEQPTIEERKKGEWILKSTNGEEFYWCSECGRVTFDDPTNYCPNCGADMRETKCQN